MSFEDAVRGVTTEVTLNRPDGPQTFKVRVPAGVHDGQRIRLPSKGGPGVNGGPAGISTPWCAWLPTPCSVATAST